MSGQAKFAPVAVNAEERDDGALLLSNALALPETTETLPERLDHWARMRPDAPFLSAIEGGARVALSYGEAAARVAGLSSRLLALPVSADRPLMIVGANGLAHALAMLAATRVGIPVAIVSPAYCSSGAPWRKFAGLAELVDPGFVLADDPAALEAVLRAIGRGTLPVRPLRNLDWLEDGDAAPPAAVAAAAQAVGPDTAAKLLFTSGSTGSPKAVVNTQRMMVSNMQGLELVWPFLLERPPVLVDWLPWNHTFGGNCCFNLALYFGGTLHIDEGKPLPALIGRSVQALRELQPTVYFNVPGGYEALLPHLESEPELARRFFSGLDFLFNAAAPMPSSVRERIEQLATRTTGRVPPIVAGWGSTETAPFSTVLYFDSPHATNLGVPLPGTEIKLVPAGGRTELRVRGPNVMPGYWRQPEATAAAFDEEGFYRIGDAGRLVDPERPEAGLLFDGRVAENFKLSSGTWVNVGALRLAVIAAAAPLVSDAVVTGEGRDEIGLLLFLNEDACRALLGEACAPLDRCAVLTHPVVTERLTTLLRKYNADQMGSSTRITRFQVLEEAPSSNEDEITDKGYLNQRAVLRRRDAIVEGMYAHLPNFPK